MINVKIIWILLNAKKSINQLIWRCIKKGVNKHDSKIKIRKFSFFREIKIDIKFIYFILFYNNVNNFSIKYIYIYKLYWITKNFKNELY